jgi:hypothetical protein
VNIDVTDTRERYVLVLGNSVRNYHKNRQGHPEALLRRTPKFSRRRLREPRTGHPAFYPSLKP